MTTFKIYKLRFVSPLHISDHHEDESFSLKTVPSDTFYAALTSCLAKTGNPIPDNGDLGFTISSLFPYYQKEEGEKPVFFLPMPLQAQQMGQIDVTLGKKIKKVKWVDASLFSELLAGKGYKNNIADIQEAYLTKENLPQDAEGSVEFVKSEVSQRVTLNSRTGEEDAKPYFVEKIVFKHHSGLYFIAEGETEMLDKALRLLSVEGIGTDRNIGFGFFDYTVDQLSLDLPQDADYQMALSLLIPESEDQLKQLMDSDKVAYDFMRRGGWITSYPYNTLRKDAIYAFLPGSVFCKAKGSDCVPVGKIVNLQPEIGDMTPSKTTLTDYQCVSTTEITIDNQHVTKSLQRYRFLPKQPKENTEKITNLLHF